jgi:glycosyltransferase involved in cell wall biosynthesis
VVNVSIILAAHQEADTIERVVSGARRAVDCAEVIVVDDGSTDATATRAHDAGATVLRSARNEGKGAAQRRGLDAASGALAVVLDADGQDDPAEIPRLLAAIDRGADLVIGSRFLGHFERGAIRPVDHVGNRLLTSAFNLLYGTALTDSQAGFRAMKTALWRRLGVTARHYDVETDVLARAVLAGAHVTEVPVTRHARVHGASGLSAVRDGTRILGRMLKCRWQGRPSR